jgi:signal transduction histidine kinase
MVLNEPPGGPDPAQVPPLRLRIVSRTPHDRAPFASLQELGSLQFVLPPAADAAPPEQAADLVLARLAGPHDLETLRALVAEAADGPPLLALVPAPDAGRPPLAPAALAAGAADYLIDAPAYWPLLPFHVRRLLTEAAAHRRIADLEQRLATCPAPPAALPSEMEIRRLMHDLRTPLTYLVGYSELLLTRESPPETVKFMANEMFREAQHLNEMIDTLHEMIRQLGA